MILCNSIGVNSVSRCKNKISSTKAANFSKTNTVTNSVHKTGSATNDLGSCIVELKQWLAKSFYSCNKTNKKIQWGANIIRLLCIKHVAPLLRCNNVVKYRLLSACEYRKSQAVRAIKYPLKNNKLEVN